MASHRPTRFLLDRHRDIETACWILRARACEDDHRRLIAAYRGLEQALTTLFDAEEAWLVPTYAAHAPVIAQRLLEAREALRRQLLQIGIGVELDTIRIEQIDDLLDALRSHAWYGDVTVYRWADAHADRDELERLAARLFGRSPDEVGPALFAAPR